MPVIFTTKCKSKVTQASATSDNVALRVSGLNLGDVVDDISVEVNSVLQAIPAGILFVDHTGIIALANKSARTIFETDLQGLCWRDVIKTHFRPQKDDGYEVSLLNGRKVKFSISKIDGTRGQLIHLTDLTETRLLQSKVAHMQKLSSLGKMVASLAHQLRTPLSAAMLYAANIANKNATEPVKKRFIEKLSKRLKELESQISDMLLFAKSGGGSFLHAISMAELLQEITAESQEANSAVHYKLDLAPSNCGVSVRGNRSALKGALLNIIQNAVAANASEITIAMDSQRNHCNVLIADNGSGIPDDIVKKIFTPFFTTKAQGTGLGLAVVASVIKSHKGSITVGNQEVSGALFEICLPISQPKLGHGKTSSTSFKPPEPEKFAGEIA